MNPLDGASDLSNQVHEVTRGFPKEEVYILTAQMKRAADSIALNIAEGSTGQSDAEFHKFLGYSIRSGMELVACLHLAIKRDLMRQDEFNSVYEEITEVTKMLHGLRKTLK